MEDLIFYIHQIIETRKKKHCLKNDSASGKDNHIPQCQRSFARASDGVSP